MNLLSIQTVKKWDLSNHLLDVTAYESTPSLPVSHKTAFWTCLGPAESFPRHTFTIRMREMFGPGWEKADVSSRRHNFLMCYVHNTHSGHFPSYERLLGWSSTVSFPKIMNKEATSAISEPSLWKWKCPSSASLRNSCSEENYEIGPEPVCSRRYYVVEDSFERKLETSKWFFLGPPWVAALNKISVHF